MEQIKYLHGDATAPKGTGPRIIAHVCNDIGGWGRGFVVAISNRWRQPEAEFRAWYASGEGFGLGQTQIVEVEPELWVANMIGQRGIRTTKAGPPVRYEAIHSCLEQLADAALERQASVHMPRIGCGLAGGKWQEIEPMLNQTLIARQISVHVYDFNGV